MIGTVPPARTFRCARGRILGRERAVRLVVLMAVTMVAGCRPERPERHEISIRGFAYLPATLEVAVGDTVVWINDDILPHTATAADSTWDTGDIAAGESAWIVARGAGDVSYHCDYHPNMRATLTIR